MTTDARQAAAGPASTSTTQAEQDPTRGVVIWRYEDMSRHWGVSRTTIERWVRRYERTGVEIPVHRDPSGRPYWLAHEASGIPDRPRVEPVRIVGDDRLDQLRRAARRSPGRSRRAL